MKGLLIKDLKLLLGQRRFYVVVLGVGILFMFTNANPSTGVGYITMILTMFTLNTISYDEFDNGMSFLMTLPIQRKTYVKEKYVFSGLVCLAAAGGSSIIAILYGFFMDPAFESLDVIITAIAMMVLSFIVLSITLPLMVKFGAEKGRMAMLIAFGMMGAAIFFVAKTFSGSSIPTWFVSFLELDTKILILFGVLILFIIIFASYTICTRIITKKEY